MTTEALLASATAALVAEMARARAPRLGAVRVVAIDGPAGSGKSTLAAAVGAALAAPLAAQVIGMDDLYEGWSGLESSWTRLEEWVLRPLAAGRPGRYRRYDWPASHFAEWHHVPIAPFLVIEGCGAARVEAEAIAAVQVWVQAPDELRLRRGLDRDGEAMRPQWETWMAEEAEHFARNRTRQRADIHVDAWGQVTALRS